MDRIRQKTTGNYALSVQALDEDGASVTLGSPATVTISDGAGAAVYTGSATITDDVLSADVPVAELPYLDTYSCLWADDDGFDCTTLVELCGGYLFSIAELRAADASYSDATRYPAARIRAARTAAEMRFEAFAGVAYVPRSRRVAMLGDGSGRLVLPDPAIRSVRSVTVDGTALTVSELADLTVREWGALDKPSGGIWTSGASIAVWYEHGLDYPPDPVVQAVMLLAPEYLTRKALSSRALTEVTDVGTFRLSVAGSRTPTGIPEVDRIALDFGRRARLVW